MSLLHRIFLFLIVFLISFISLYYLLTAPARAHYVPGRHNAVHAIQLTWCGKSNMECAEGDKAIRVAICEASSYWWFAMNRPTEARNGQYLGMFQMGAWARSTYGHGSDPWSQARAAHRNWLANGWQPQWECAFRLGIR